MNVLKEPAISRTIVRWTEDWAKDKLKTDGAVSKVLFSNKYKDLGFTLPDTGHMYYICKEGLVFQRRYGWVIYAQCDLPGVEDDAVTIFLS